MAKLKQEIKIELELSLEEALWLRSVLQNPVFEGECSQDYHSRKDIFHALNDCELLRG